MSELLKVDSNTQRVSARELHERLAINTRFNVWFHRMAEYGFVENTDYKRVSQKCDTLGGKQDIVDYQITIDMAKHICMIQRSPEGKEVRQYLIDLEKAWNTPEAVMARALQFAQQTIESLRPKAEYFDALVDRNLLLNFTDTAKELGIKRKKFIQWLIDNKYCYRDLKGDIKPYTQYSNTATENRKYFELKEWQNDFTSGNQTMITPRGREAFRLLYKG